MILETQAYARVGLMGNPSDIFYGKTIAAAIQNFQANVRLWESPSIELRRHPIHDSTQFESIAQLEERARIEGYYGGMRLVFATCKKFREFCDKRGVSLHSRNFTIEYDTNIPRQVGLGGSSAIITAVIRALMQFYEIRAGGHFPKPELPNLTLSVETEELDITAGLQDRVVQAYGGTVFMDFDEALMLEYGYGDYSRIDGRTLPPLFLAYRSASGESGKVHNNVRFRYEAGDREVIDAMKRFAQFAVEARHALAEGDMDSLGALMNQNFDLRRQIFGDKAMDPRDIEMVELARSLGCPAKFSGSRAAVVGFCLDEQVMRRLARAYQEKGFSFEPIRVEMPNADE